MEMNKTLGLSMIVKNEAHVIKRLLNSVSPIIDYWGIVDTGSTDGTQQIIKDFFTEKGIPGELKEVEWIDDFSFARNESLKLVEDKVDYGIWIDADEELILEPSFDKQALLNSGYKSISLKAAYNSIDYTRKNIWKTGCDFFWKGPIHELLSCPPPCPETVAVGLYVLIKPEGSSWTNISQKYKNHAKILEKYLEQDNDTRWIFYTAQSYRDATTGLPLHEAIPLLEKSIYYYNKRAQIDAGFKEEIFISRFMIATLSEGMNKPVNELVKLYKRASDADQLRGEAVKSLIKLYHKHKEYEKAYVISLFGTRFHLKNPYPYRILYLDKTVYEYEMLELHALSCYYTNRHDEGGQCYWYMRKYLDSQPAGYISDSNMAIIKSNEKYFKKPVNIDFRLPFSQQPMVNKPRGSNFTPPKKKRK